MIARLLITLLWVSCVLLVSQRQSFAQAQAETHSAAAGRMLYHDTPAIRGSVQACLQCHATPALQRRGQSLQDQQDFIRCAIQGGCGGALMAVYPYGNMAQFQGLLSSADIAHLAHYIRAPDVVAAWPKLSASRIDAGRRAVGTEASFNITLENRGEAALPIRGAEVVGGGARDFEVDTRQCPALLGPAGQCTIHVTHRPSCGVRRGANLNVLHGGPPLAVTAQLTGMGDGAMPPQMATSERSLRLDASTALKGVASVDVFNSCGGVLDVSGLRVDGPFELLTDVRSCRGLGSGQSCRVQLRRSQINAAPQAIQASTGTLWIASNEDGAEQPVSLQAEALKPAVVRWLGLQPVTETQVGSSATQEVARVENIGSTSLILSEITSSDEVFQIAPNKPEHCSPGMALQTGASCAIRLSYAPRSEGLQQASIHVLAAPGAVASSYAISARALSPLSPQTGGGAADALIGVLMCLAMLYWANSRWQARTRPNRRDRPTAKSPANRPHES